MIVSPQAHSHSPIGFHGPIIILLLWNCLGRVDYPPEPVTQLTFGSGVSRLCINVSVIEDSEVEGTEVFEVSLGTEDDAVLIQPNTTLVVILDDDGELIIISEQNMM
jgi:hypothetical protein